VSVSKRTRFEVFKRDGFRCVYCGATATDALLEVDHITAVSAGGDDDIENLATSCWSCNAGKRELPLSDVTTEQPHLLSMLERGRLAVRMACHHLIEGAYSGAIAPDTERLLVGLIAIDPVMAVAAVSHAATRGREECLGWNEQCRVIREFLWASWGVECPG